MLAVLIAGCGARAGSAGRATPTPGALANTPPYAGLKVVAGPADAELPSLEGSLALYPASSNRRWSFFHCADPIAQLEALYRQGMTQKPYSWSENNWEEVPGGVLGIYYSYSGNCWLSIWFLDAPLPGSECNVVVLWEQAVSEPLTLPHHHM